MHYAPKISKNLIAADALQFRNKDSNMILHINLIRILIMTLIYI